MGNIQFLCQCELKNPGPWMGMNMLPSRGKSDSLTFNWALVWDCSRCLCGFSILLLPFIIFAVIKLLGWPRFPHVRLAIILKSDFAFCLCGL